MTIKATRFHVSFVPETFQGRKVIPGFWQGIRERDDKFFEGETKEELLVACQKPVSSHIL